MNIDLIQIVRFCLTGFFCFSGLMACNLVDRYEATSIRKLDKHGITNFCLEKDSCIINAYSGGSADKPLLVFIHGFGGDAQLSWKNAMIEFSENYQVLALDLLWFGKSYSDKKACLNTQADAVLSLVNEVCDSTKRYTMIGHSYGGFVTLATYFKDPARVNGMVIIDSPGMTYDTTQLELLEKQAQVNHYSDLFVLQNPQGIDRLNDMAFEKPPHIPKFIKKDVYAKYFASHHEALRSLLTTLPNDKNKFLNEPPTFPRTLIIWGENDRVFPLDEGRKLAEYMKADLKIIPDVGHTPIAENYKMFKEILSEFLISFGSSN